MADTATKLSVRTDPKAVGPAPKAREWPMFADLRREMDRLFDEFGRDWFRTPALLRPAEFEPMMPMGTGIELRPAVDVVETAEGWRVTAELPGMDDKAIDVSIAGDVLTLKGEKTETKEENDKGAHISERRYGSFERSFTLPEGIDRDHIEAKFANGVLTVMLPKTAGAATPAKKIEVEAA